MITTDLTGNLGNHMWQYAICRIVAEHNGYDWGINRIPSHDYHHGSEQMEFMDIDYGQEHATPFGEMPPGVEKIWKERKETFHHLGTVNFHPYQPDIFDVEDNTKLVIECCQDERYLQGKKEKIRQWFKIKDENIHKYQQILKKKHLSLDENVCVLNIRGGEYLSFSTLLLEKKYWDDAVTIMRQKNPEMKFIVISDDVKYVKKILPFPVYHFSVGMDYFILNQAHNLILSNSSFALFPAWLNSNCKMIIAPKYWARHNISYGYWASSSVYMKGWSYLDRDGRLNSYEDILKEEQAKGKKHGKVYDAILFFNELDILEIRLNTLDPVVDYFIISESTKTHSGLPKPLYFNENKDRFKQFEKKIIHQIIEDTPDDYTDLSNEIPKDAFHKMVIEKVMRGDWWPHDVPSYGRDTFEKESLIRAMKNCQPDDIIIFSDADEIPNPDVVDGILKNFNPEKIYNFKQKTYFYYFNCLKEENWVGNTLLSFEKLKNLSICELRMRRQGEFVQDGGWHFSFMGGTDRIVQKIESYGEQSLNTDLVKEHIQDNVENCILNEHDLFFRPCKFWMVPIDQTYPRYILENITKFEGHIKELNDRPNKKSNKISRVIWKFITIGKTIIRPIYHSMRNIFSKVIQYKD